MVPYSCQVQEAQDGSAQSRTQESENAAPLYDICLLSSVELKTEDRRDTIVGCDTIAPRLITLEQCR